MKLPQIIADEQNQHLLLLLLSTINLLLLVTFFFLLVPTKTSILPKFLPTSERDPVVRLDLISPAGGSTVSGTVPLVVTLSNGPKIQKTTLQVNGQNVQSLTSQKTEKLTVFWDTTKHADGKNNITINILTDQNSPAVLTTTFTVNNNVSRNEKVR